MTAVSRETLSSVIASDGTSYGIIRTAEQASLATPLRASPRALGCRQLRLPSPPWGHSLPAASPGRGVPRAQNPAGQRCTRSSISVPRYEHRAKAPAPRPAWPQPPAALQLRFPGTSVEKLDKLWRPRGRGQAPTEYPNQLVTPAVERPASLRPSPLRSRNIPLLSDGRGVLAKTHGNFRSV